MIELVSEPIVDLYAQVRTASERAEKIIDVVVQKYAAELDEFVQNTESYLNAVRDSDTQQFDDATLERMVLRLPIILYKVCKGLERASMDSDVSKAAVEIVKAQNYLNAPKDGTIPERKAHAEIKTADEMAVVDLTKHVHNRLKNKIEHANSLFDGLRKVLTARNTDKSVFGREQRR